MAKNSPVSYKDPYWTGLASDVEARLDLPRGLLSAIVTRGERSNADQVSEAGARTVFQIIPATRKAAIDKWGIDPMLSDENAAEVAGRLLKESLQRNKGDAALAVAEYHGGTDRSNWGPRTRAYVQRVTGAAQAQATTEPGAAPDRAMITRAYDAYRAGRMDPQAVKEFEEDVNSGAIQLPLGASLKRSAQAAAPASAFKVPASAIDAYTSGRMDPEAAAQFEADVRSDPSILPAGVTLPARPAADQPGFIQRIGESITGSGRKVEATEALPDWTNLPELNTFSLASAKAGLGTLLANPQEAVQVIQSNFPGAQVRQDEKGNFIVRSSIDGKEYAIKPGFRPSDIPRAVAGMAAFTPAGRAATIPGAALATGATQAAIEASQAATGGEFSPAEVGTAALTGAAIPAIARGIQAVRGARAPAAAAAQVTPGAPAAAAPAKAAPAAAAAAPLPAEKLAETARKASAGGLGAGRATRVLAEQAAPDTKTVEAARRLGIEQHLQPDHVTTNQAYRELSQAVKSVPGSEARAAEMHGLDAVAKRADDLIAEIGGTTDVSTLSSTLKGRMMSTVSRLEDGADKMYAELRDAIPAKAEAPAPTVLQFIKQRADDLGGERNLTGMERNILSKLSPRKDGTQPTYALMDDVRRELTAARVKRQGAFKDADTGLIKKLERELLEDQRAVVDSHGQTELFNAARQIVAVRKGIEDDVTSLFGKTLDGTIVGDLAGAVRALPQGDSARLVKLLKSVPEDMRQEVAASGLASAFKSASTRGAINFGTYSKWYEGLLRNKQAYTALMTNLPPGARKQLSDLYRVSKGISAATRERITTGRIQAVTEELKGADNLVGNLYDLAKRTAVGVPAEAATSAVGLPGAGLAAALSSALTKGKTAPIKAADKLISSPEFLAMAKASGTSGEKSAASKLARSHQFKRYVQAIGNPKEMSNSERWILQAVQARQQTQERQ